MGFVHVIWGLILGWNVVSCTPSSFLIFPFGERNASSQIPVPSLNVCTGSVKLDKSFMLQGSSSPIFINKYSYASLQELGLLRIAHEHRLSHSRSSTHPPTLLLHIHPLSLHILPCPSYTYTPQLPAWSRRWLWFLSLMRHELIP